MLHLSMMLETLARSGGGGSSGGGGGGGGGFFALIGYVPSYYLGKLIKKLLPRTPELIVSGAFATVASVSLLAVGAQGGFIGTIVTLEIVAGIWIGWAAAFFGVWDKLRLRAKKTKAVIDQAARSDGAWDEARLQEYARKVFFQYQQDWSTSNVTSIATYSTPRYAQHAGLLLAILH